MNLVPSKFGLSAKFKTTFLFYFIFFMYYRMFLKPQRFLRFTEKHRHIDMCLALENEKQWYDYGKNAV